MKIELGFKSDIKVIKIIDDMQIVINAGTEYGIKNGDKFEIYLKGIEIFDPVTNEALGTLDFIKARVQAFTVYPKMTICKNERTRDISFVDALSFWPKSYTQRESLNVNKDEISGGFENADKIIRIGDLVRRVD